MAFAVPLVKKDYQLYALPQDRRRSGGRSGIAARSRGSISASGSFAALPRRKRSVSDPSLFSAAAAAAVSSNAHHDHSAPRRMSTGAASALSRLIRRTSSTPSSANSSPPSTPTEPKSPSVTDLNTAPSTARTQEMRYCGGRRGSGGHIERLGSMDHHSVYTILTAIAEAEEEATEEELEVPIKMLKDSEEELNDPALFQIPGARKPSMYQEKPPDITSISEQTGTADQIRAAPVYICKSEVDQVVRMSPESKRKWKRAFMSGIRSRLSAIERVLSTATPAN